MFMRVPKAVLVACAAASFLTTGLVNESRAGAECLYWLNPFNWFHHGCGYGCGYGGGCCSPGYGYAGYAPAVYSPSYYGGSNCCPSPCGPSGCSPCGPGGCSTSYYAPVSSYFGGSSGCCDTGCGVGGCSTGDCNVTSSPTITNSPATTNPQPEPPPSDSVPDTNYDDETQGFERREEGTEAVPGAMNDRYRAMKPAESAIENPHPAPMTIPVEGPSAIRSLERRLTFDSAPEAKRLAISASFSVPKIVRQPVKADDGINSLADTQLVKR